MLAQLGHDRGRVRDKLDKLDLFLCEVILLKLECCGVGLIVGELVERHIRRAERQLSRSLGVRVGVMVLPQNPDRIKGEEDFDRREVQADGGEGLTEGAVERQEGSATTALARFLLPVDADVAVFFKAQGELLAKGAPSCSVGVSIGSEACGGGCTLIRQRLRTRLVRLEDQSTLRGKRNR